MTYLPNGTAALEGPEAAKSEAQEWRASLGCFVREFIRAPGAMFGMAVSCTVVVWASSAGLFPGTGRTRSWPVWLFGPVVVLGWLGLYAAVATLLLRYGETRRARRIVHRMAWCFVALTACGMLPFLCEPLVNMYIRQLLIHLRLYMLACLVVSARIALPQEMRALWGRFWPTAFVRARRNWVCLGAATVGTVAAAESVFYAASDMPMRMFPLLGAMSLALNVAVLLGLIFLLLAATNRLAFAVAVVYTLYFSLAACNIGKVHYMRAAVQPLDLIYLGDLMLVFTKFFGRGTAIGLAVGGLLWLAGLVWIWRQWPSRLSRPTRLRIAAVWGAVLVALAGSIGSRPGRTALAWLGIESLVGDTVKSTCSSGMVLNMALELPHVAVHRPGGYSEGEIVRCVQVYYARSAQGTTQGGSAERVNLVIYVVESMMDPLDLGYAFTADPIPTVRANRRMHTGGYAIVPETMASSANTEFELLTGMAMYFLPYRSCPYKQYIKRDIPSLPWLLKKRGYRTSAAIVDPPRLYNRQGVFRHLGFDEVTWLSERSGVQLDVRGAVVADETLVDAVIAETRKPGPQFIYADTDSTHSPYNYPQYLGSDLDIVDPMKQSARDELKTYINAIHTADTAIAKLLSAMQRSERKTVVVILGDHLPPLSEQGGIYSPTGAEQGPDLDLVRRRQQVPLVIWTNFGSPRKDLVCGVQFLPTHILATMGIRPRGFLALNEAFASQLSVLSGYVQTAEGERFARNAPPARLEGLIRDYELVQYDLLLGKQFAVRPLREADGRP